MSQLGIHNLTVFLVTSLLISLLPGPATMYIVGRSASQGRRAGLLSVFGIGTGSLCHIVAVAVGASAIFAASHLAFTVVKLAGAGYLLYLGIVTLRTPSMTPEADTVNRADSPGDCRVYFQGLATQVLNPKASLFFLAILPQFVESSAAHTPVPFLVLGAIFVAIDTLWFSTLACGAAAAGAWWRRAKSAGPALRYAVGVLYLALGLALLRERWNSAR